MNRKELYFVLGCLLLAGCSDSSGGGDVPPVTPDVPVGFSTGVGGLDVRSVGTDAPATRAAGLIETTEDLQQTPEGFGVFAYMTGSSDNPSDAGFSRQWTAAITAADGSTPLASNTSAYPVPDFMYNQQVTWGIQYVDNTDADHPKNVYNWVYSPLKYWPNSTENTAPRYVSFFAYAPYGSANITGMTDADDKSPHVTYTLAGNGIDGTDLLWAKKTDATRNGQGLITETDGEETWQKVPLEFKHALACVDIYVRRVYDEPTPTGKTPTDKTDTLFVSRLTLDSGSTEGSALYGGGTFDLDKGTWRAGTLTRIPPTGGHYTLTYTETQLLDSIAGTTSDDPLRIRDRELNKVGLADEKTPANLAAFGVASEERHLFPAGTSLIFFPQAGLTLTPTLTYSMVTHDDDLLLSDLTDSKGRTFYRRLNTVTGNPVNLSLEAGKRYKLVILIGTEDITFEAVSVIDWDFPMRVNPAIVEGFTEEEDPKTLDEK